MLWFGDRRTGGGGEGPSPRETRELEYPERTLRDIGAICAFPIAFVALTTRFEGNYVTRIA